MSDNPQHPASWYAASAHAAPSHPHLAGAQQVDVCVLGAGLTGLTTALELAEAGYKVVVLESESVGWGASGRTGGQVIFGFGCGESKLQALPGKADAHRRFEIAR